MTTALSPFGAQLGLGTQDGQWALDGLDEAWGTWDDSGDAAVGVKHIGDGAVVIVGANSFTINEQEHPQFNKAFRPYAGMNAYVFGDEELDTDFRYYRIGHNVLVVPIEGVPGGEVFIPDHWLDETFEQMAIVMDRQSGLFDEAAWSAVAGGYEATVPEDHLLMWIATGSPIPEPTSLALLGLGGLALLVRPRKSGAGGHA